MIPEGLIKDRVETLASKIYHDQLSAGHDQLDLIVIMDSAFRYFTDLLAALNRLSEKPGQKPLKIRVRFVKVST
jgi:hypoxanthine-guanine phosphoribosyltransferase